MTQEDLQECFPESELVFLPDRMFDDALVGIAVRKTTPVVPVYRYDDCRRAVALLDPLEAHARLTSLFVHDIHPAPLILMPVHRQSFWENNKKGKIVVWDGAHDAIVGTGRRGLEPEVAVYAYPLMIKALQRSMESSVSGFNSAEEFFEAYVLQTWLGPQTPYVLYPAQ